MKKVLKYHYKRKCEKDQFYTKQSLAKDLTNIVVDRYGGSQIFLEPSAGSGVFLKELKRKKIKFKAFDIEPKHREIKKTDFLSLDMEDKDLITIGNPPFGKNSSLAIKFFNKCSSYSLVIAFILPRTFRKISTQEKLNERFHLAFDMNLPKNSFVFKDKEFDVPSCFQIWERKKVKRKKINLKNKYIEFVSPEESDFCVRRVGGRSGSVLEGSNYSPSSTYFIKEKRKGIKEIAKRIDFSPIVNNTAGVRSLSKKELVLAIHNEVSAK